VKDKGMGVWFIIISIVVRQSLNKGDYRKNGSEQKRQMQNGGKRCQVFILLLAIH
jgi:hypothetical protein